METKIFQCGFCGQSIEGILRPIAITFETGPSEFQNLYCHQGCLRKALHPTVSLSGKD